MSNKIKQFQEYIKGKRITVIGIGISNRPLIEYLVRFGAIVTACDRKKREALGETAAYLEALGVTLQLGDGYLQKLDADIIFKTPGLRFDTPELLAAKETGAVVTSEMEVFFALCPAKIFAVTGSDGKTTTTTLIHRLLTEQGYRCHLGGNIGNPLLSNIDDICEDDYVVLELSSFQLQTMKKSPRVAVITNISPNHLDMHKNYQEYIDAKKNIMLYQNEDDLVILNKDNDVTAALIPEAKGRCVTFSRTQEADICLDGGYITANGRKVLNTADIKVPGLHNVENFMAAIGATASLVDREVILKVAREFGGVEHRIEFVRELSGVKFYNSSIDSSPNRTINTLRVFNSPVVLIAGGKDKGIPYDALGPVLLERVKALVLVGATADVIEQSLKDAETKAGGTKHVPVYRETSYEAAVPLANSLADSGDVVLLSNASTSFDMFQNFEERGNLFKELVNNL